MLNTTVLFVQKQIESKHLMQSHKSTREADRGTNILTSKEAAAAADHWELLLDDIIGGLLC